MMALYTIYLFAFVIPLYALTTVFLAINFLYFQEMLAYVLIISVGYVPLVVSTLFTLYWIPKFYKSITYCMTESEVRVERGVWWKERHAIPYSRIM
ncbi:MAG TPA: PH domain-containing protein, partial [Candidatus Methanomethylicus sp.]|nr:PH domain-containing protein [Candidatus Methanomethylicus sp.]